MKKIAILIAIFYVPLLVSAQTFDAFEDEKDVTSVVVTKNMFKLLSKIDLESQDPEAQEYISLINNLDNIKIYTTENPEVAKRMNICTVVAFAVEDTGALHRYSLLRFKLVADHFNIVSQGQS